MEGKYKCLSCGSNDIIKTTFNGFQCNNCGTFLGIDYADNDKYIKGKTIYQVTGIEPPEKDKISILFEPTPENVKKLLSDCELYKRACDAEVKELEKRIRIFKAALAIATRDTGGEGYAGCIKMAKELFDE